MLMDDRLLVSIVCPFFNESNNISAFYEGLTSVLDHLPKYRFEVICVDDGSEDRTLGELLEIVCNDDRFSVIELSRNFGKESALSAGIEATQGDAVILIDADLQDPVSLVHRLIEAWESSGADVVLARRRTRHHDGLIKRWSATAFYRVFNLISAVRMPPDVGDCRLMSRQVVNCLLSLPETQRFMKGLYTWVGFKPFVIEFERERRFSGVTKFSWWRLWNFGIEGITSFSTALLRVWLYFGLFGAFLTVAFGAYSGFRLIFDVDFDGYDLKFNMLLFGMFTQFIAVGVIGEYVGRIYMESKRRPAYVVRKAHGRFSSVSGNVPYRQQ